MTLGRILTFGAAAIGLSVVNETFAPLVLAAMVWLGVGLAVRLRPSTGDLTHERRLPRLDELAALAIGQGGAIATFVAMSLMLIPLQHLFDWRAPSLVEGIGWVLWAASATAVAAPLWREVGADGARRLVPAALGLVAAIPLFIGIGLLWEVAIEPLMRGQTWSDARFGGLIAAPACLFLAAAGVAAVAEALAPEASAARLLRRSVEVGLLAWSAVVVILVLDVAGLAAWPRFTAVRGGAAGGAYAVVIALAWLFALWSVRRMQRVRAAGAVGVIAFLSVAMLVSMAVPAGTTGGEWAEFVAVILFPFMVITAALVAFAVPALCRLGQWRPRRQTDLVQRV